MQIFVVLAAAGSGSRFHSTDKKQFLTLAGKTLIEHSVDAFLSLPNLAEIALVLPKESASEIALANPKIKIVVGGASRAESVKHGIAAFKNAKAEDCILVHDAARPLVSRALIERVVKAVSLGGAAIPVLTVQDTIKQVDNEKVLTTVNRESLRAAQTPQGARFDWISQCFQKPDRDLSQITDEAMLLEVNGFSVSCVAGEKSNIKITTPEDAEFAEFYFKR